MTWYCTQQFFVRWGNVFSFPFSASNGVRQGGILSPLFFNLYMDDISNTLNSCQQGCTVNGVSINHLIYADDMVLLAPSAHALQLLLNHCDTYATSHDIIYNTKKSVCMCIKPKQLKSTNDHVFELSGKNLKHVASHKYLGVNLTADRKDDTDIQQQYRNIYIAEEIC